MHQVATLCLRCGLARAGRSNSAEAPPCLLPQMDLINPQRSSNHCLTIRLMWLVRLSTMMVQILMKIVLICLRGCNSALIRLQRKVFTNDYPNCRHLLSSHVTVINSQRPFIKLKITTLSWQGLAQISRLCQNCLKNLSMAKRNKISRTRAMHSFQVLNGNLRPSSAVLMSLLPIRLV